MYWMLRILALLVGLGLPGVTPLLGQSTESPVTVRPGRWLLELDVIARNADRGPDFHYRSVGVASTLVSTGLGPGWDVQVGMDVFQSERLEAGGVVERPRGAGDFYLRTKWCFLENAETGFGLALLPYVTIPTGSGGMGSGSVEGGLIVPVAVSLAPELELALMLGLDGLRHETKAGYGAHWHLSAALSRTITRALGGYLEAGLTKPSGENTAQTWAGVGLTWAQTESRSWDLAVYRGIAAEAMDWTQVLRFNLEF
jgi:hypothetical protein